MDDGICTCCWGCQYREIRSKNFKFIIIMSTLTRHAFRFQIHYDSNSGLGIVNKNDIGFEFISLSYEHIHVHPSPWLYAFCWVHLVCVYIIIIYAKNGCLYRRRGWTKVPPAAFQSYHIFSATPYIYYYDVHSFRSEISNVHEYNHAYMSFLCSYATTEIR